MPESSYIICCESGTEDKFTGLASLFNVVDRIHAKRPAPVNPGDSTPILLNAISLRIVAVWRAVGDGDFEGEFQSEVRMTLLPLNDVQILLSDTFRFQLDKSRHRIVIIIGGLTAGESGQLVVESRIKRPDAAEWLTQSYVVDVLVDEPDSAAVPPV
jgi:hypothetical protein